MAQATAILPANDEASKQQQTANVNKFTDTSSDPSPESVAQWAKQNSDMLRAFHAQLQGGNALVSQTAATLSVVAQQSASSAIQGDSKPRQETEPASASSVDAPRSQLSAAQRDPMPHQMGEPASSSSMDEQEESDLNEADKDVLKQYYCKNLAELWNKFNEDPWSFTTIDEDANLAAAIGRGYSVYKGSDQEGPDQTALGQIRISCNNGFRKCKAEETSRYKRWLGVQAAGDKYDYYLMNMASTKEAYAKYLAKKNQEAEDTVSDEEDDEGGEGEETEKDNEDEDHIKEEKGEDEEFPMD